MSKITGLDELYPEWYAMFCDKVAIYLGKNLYLKNAAELAVKDMVKADCPAPIANRIAKWQLPYMKKALENL